MAEGKRRSRRFGAPPRTPGPLKQEPHGATTLRDAPDGEGSSAGEGPRDAVGGGGGAQTDDAPDPGPPAPSGPGLRPAGAVPARRDARPGPVPTRVGRGWRILATPSRGGCTLVVGRVRPTTAALRRRTGLPTGAPEERGTRIPRPSPIAS